MCSSTASAIGSDVTAVPRHAELSNIERKFVQNYRPELWQATRAALGVVGSLSLKNRDHCLALVFVGASGQGKSITVRMVSPTLPDAKQYLARVDNFTPASFVSHAANRSAEDLEKIDLLPKIKNRVMVTKELAPLFTGDEKELKKNFATLTSVLDGNGYETSSGAHGSRGYSGEYLFNWIGATTPIPDRTYRVMAQLGNRFLFYHIESQEPTEADLLGFAERYRGNDTVSEFQTELNNLIVRHFEKYPANSVEPEDVRISSDQNLSIVRYAMLVARGRIQIDFDDEGDPEPQPAEGEQRIILLLQMLARGLALSDGRREVADDDLKVVRHVALSTLPYRRMLLLKGLMASAGELSIRDVEAVLSVSTPSASQRMRELAATGIARFTHGRSATSTAATLRLADGWEWLVGTPPIKILGV
jgi:hypothetical protein